MSGHQHFIAGGGLAIAPAAISDKTLNVRVELWIHLLTQMVLTSSPALSVA
jgi:hypothetical protein